MSSFSIRSASRHFDFLYYEEHTLMRTHWRASEKGKEKLISTELGFPFPRHEILSRGSLLCPFIVLALSLTLIHGGPIAPSMNPDEAEDANYCHVSGISEISQCAQRTPWRWGTIRKGHGTTDALLAVEAPSQIHHLAPPQQSMSSKSHAGPDPYE